MNENLRDIVTVPVKGLKALTGSLNYIKRAKLWLQVLIAMVLGILLGSLLSPESGLIDPSTSSLIGEWIALPGYLFLALIQMVVVPLILASIVQGISAAVDVDQLKSTGLWVTLFFLGTTALAVTIGISVGSFVQPGSYIDSKQLALSVEDRQELEQIQATADEVNGGGSEMNLKELPRTFTGILPQNPLNSLVEGDMLQIVIFAIIIGLGMLLLKKESAQPLSDLFGSIQEVSMAIVGLAMSFAPLAVFGLLTQSMIQTGPHVLLGMGVYSASVVGAMVVLYFIYVSLAVVLGRRAPMDFIRATREPALIGFSTNSSAATMPVTVKSAEENLNISRSNAQFIIPLGATINMGGTACYQGLTTMFMAQLFDLDLSLSALTALTVTAVGASVGTPAVPGVGIIVLSGVLSSAGVPLAGLPLILGLDRILERFRTSLNVTGDLTACAVIDKGQLSSERRELD
jgi:Na+/H+-dicarboxylate symporter